MALNLGPVKHDSPPLTCELCGQTILDHFMEGTTAAGEHAKTCLLCARTKKIDTSNGNGKLFQRQGDEYFLVKG